MNVSENEKEKKILNEKKHNKRKFHVDFTVL